jgi:dephospho-CoA kinase
MSIIIGLIGQKLAGKDTVASYLKDRYGAVSYAGGHILNEILLALGQETSRENETRLAVTLRTEFGEEVLNSAILHRLKASNAKIGLINGIRRPKELLQAQSEGVRTVYISAPPEVRYERYKFRQEKKDDGVLAYSEFLKQDAESPTEKDIPKIGEQAEFFLENTGDLTSLYSQVDELMHTLLTAE